MTDQSPLVDRLRRIPDGRRKDFLGQLRNAVDQDAPGPLSARQEQLWLVGELGRTAAYALAYEFRLTGPL
ncbi:hypothetical protein ACFQ1S_39660, partial [Kibdelosporangium lantanae]